MLRPIESTFTTREHDHADHRNRKVVQQPPRATASSRPTTARPTYSCTCPPLERAGLRTLGEGERVRFEPRPGRDGRMSAEGLSLLAPTDDAAPPQSATGRQAGTVKWFNTAKGFGFIAPDDGSEDAFVHVSAVERAGLGTLQEGQRVQFELRPGRNGKFSAENLAAAD